MKDYIQIAIIIILAILLIRKCEKEPKEMIKYVKGETITDTVFVPDPYIVEIPSEPKYIYRTDTIFSKDTVIVEVIDTVAIVRDWTYKRKYTQTLFNNDTLGKFTLNTEVQYNKLQSVDYKFEPIIREITIDKRKPFSISLQIGYGASKDGFSPYAGIGLGYSIYSF